MQFTYASMWLVGVFVVLSTTVCLSMQIYAVSSLSYGRFAQFGYAPYLRGCRWHAPCVWCKHLQWSLRMKSINGLGDFCITTSFSILILQWLYSKRVNTLFTFKIVQQFFTYVGYRWAKSLKLKGIIFIAFLSNS